MKPNSRRGFTLIELLVVIAIIAILAAILFPVFAQARDKARQSSCQSNLKQIGTAIKMYAQDYDEQGLQYWWNYGGAGGTAPPWMEWIDPYVKNAKVFLCPSAPLTVSTYTSSCTAVSTATVTSTYVTPSNIYYSYWNLYGVVMFSGFPSGVNPGTGTAPCVNAYDVCQPSPEMVAYPSEAALLIEGYTVSYMGYPSKFGHACQIGWHNDPTAKHINRHNEGGNVLYCDGHVKAVHARRFWGDNSARTSGAYAGYAQGAHMRVGP
ncbi:MAG: DUF1559 domain-containing protein [Actinomycetota bacterium]